MPAIQQRYERYRAQGFTVLAVDADEAAAEVAPFVAAYQLSFTILLDPQLKTSDLYRVRGYPTSYFVDRAGFIRILHIGSMSDVQLDGYLKTLGFES
jgi:peroxiredoxin